MPPFFLPLYSRSVGLSSATGAGLLAGFNFSSAVGRVVCGLFCDKLGALNTLFLCLALNALTMLVIWPVSKSLSSLALFVIMNGAANGGFFSTMPTVVGNVFGSQRVSVAMGMIVTGWGGGYLMVGHLHSRLEWHTNISSIRALRSQVIFLRHMAEPAKVSMHTGRLYSMLAPWHWALQDVWVWPDLG